MILKLNLQSPYNLDGTPREDLPAGEVLAWDGKNYHIGFLRKDPKKWGDNESQVNCISVDNTVLYNVVRFAPLPTIIESNDLL